jgi:hypothetical protein
MAQVIEPETRMTGDEIISAMQTSSLKNKDRIRNSIEDSKEMIMTIFGQDQENHLQLMKSVLSLQGEIGRLRELCKKHGIDSAPPKPKEPNRATRRKAEKVAKKAKKQKAKN